MAFLRGSPEICRPGDVECSVRVIDHGEHDGISGNTQSGLERRNPGDWGTRKRTAHTQQAVTRTPLGSTARKKYPDEVYDVTKLLTCLSDVCDAYMSVQKLM